MMLINSMIVYLGVDLFSQKRCKAQKVEEILLCIINMHARTTIYKESFYLVEIVLQHERDIHSIAFNCVI